MRKLRSFILVLVVVPGLLSTAAARTLTQLKSDVRIAIRDTGTSTSLQRYTDQQITDILNEGQRFVSNVLHPCQNFTTLTLATNTTWYTLPSDFLYARKVRYFQTGGKQPIELLETSVVDTISNNPAYDKLTGTPYQYLVNFSTGLNSNNFQMAIISPPNSASVGTVTVQYYQQCPDLVNGTDIPFNNQSFYLAYDDSITYFAIAKISGIDGDTESEKMYSDLFQAAIKNMQTAIGQLPNYRPSANGSNYPQSR